MGLGVEIYKPLIIGSGVYVDGKWYAGDCAAAVGASMKLDGWTVTVNDKTLHVTRGGSSKSITFHPASAGRPLARDRPAL